MEDQHSSKRARADTKPDLEGVGLNTESPTTKIRRLLDGNTRLLVLRPDDATIWEKRRLLVEEFMFDLEEELDFVGKLAERHSKNYLVWDYRRWIVEKLGPEAASKELEFAKKILSQGTRNYQAWSHRKWVIEKFDRSWLAELQYCHEILEKDIFGILVWDQICCAAMKLNSTMDELMRDKEASFATNAIYAQPGNEGPWRYLKCLYVNDQKSLYTNPNLQRVYVDILAEEANRVQDAVKLDPCDNKEHALVDKRGCVHALHLILDLIILGFKVNSNERLVNAVDVLLDNCARSSTRVDPSRIEMFSKVFKKVSALMLSLDARRIRYCNIYRGHSRIKVLHYKYVNSLQEYAADMQLDEDDIFA